MKKDLRLLLRSNGAAEIVSCYGLGESLADPNAVPGLSDLQRERLVSLQALTKHLTTQPEVGHSISSSGDVFEKYKHKYGSRVKEQFVVLTLNSRNQVTGESVVAVGSVNTVHVHPSEVLRPAVVSGSPSILVIHNHPSGDPTPSPEDRSLTERIASAAALMGIRLLDHVILAAAHSYYSFSDSGAI